MFRSIPKKRPISGQIPRYHTQSRDIPPDSNQSCQLTPRPLIPASALLSPRAGEAIIFVLDKNNRAVRRTVQIGAAGDRGVEVRSGLKAGEAVIVSNLDRLRDGAVVAPSRLR